MTGTYTIGDDTFKIEPASCRCGGSWAWLKERPSGAWEMVGCICHTPLLGPTRAVNPTWSDTEQTDELSRAEARVSFVRSAKPLGFAILKRWYLEDVNWLLARLNPMVHERDEAIELGMKLADTRDRWEDKVNELRERMYSLAAKWRQQRLAFPTASNREAQVAAATVKLCEDELIEEADRELA